MRPSSVFFSCEHLSSQDKNFRANHVSKVHMQGITDTSFCNFTSPGCLPEILVPSSNQGREANAVSLLQQTKQRSSKRKCGQIPSDTTKLEMIMTVGSTHLISAASWVGVTHWVIGLDIKWCSRYSRCKGISTSAHATAAALTERAREARLFKKPFFCTHWKLGGPQNYFQK